MKFFKFKWNSISHSFLTPPFPRDHHYPEIYLYRSVGSIFASLSGTRYIHISKLSYSRAPPPNPRNLWQLGSKYFVVQNRGKWSLQKTGRTEKETEKGCAACASKAWEEIRSRGAWSKGAPLGTVASVWAAGLENGACSLRYHHHTFLHWGACCPHSVSASSRDRTNSVF